MVLDALSGLGAILEVTPRSALRAPREGGEAGYVASSMLFVGIERMNKVNLKEKLDTVSEHWRPRVIGELNGQEVKVVKFKGEFPWHHHKNEDEMFMGLKGKFRLEFRDRSIEISGGEFVIVPRGVEHRPVAKKEVEVLLFEPANLRNTGNIDDPEFTVP